MTDSQVQPETAGSKRNQRTLYMILLVAFLPMVLAYTMFFTGVGVPDHTVNKGQLLPHPVNLEQLLGIADSPLLKDIQEQKKWRLVVPIPAHCDDSCQQNLYTTRQVHIRLGEKSVRVERLAVNLAGLEGQQYLDSIAADHPKLKTTSVDPQVWQHWLAESGAQLDLATEHFYLLVDQEGFAMMSYTTAQHGNELLKDLKRALKYSIDYQ